MSYREKLEKYKKDQLPEEEKKKVEDEVEKAEAINEYLADKLEEELMEDDEAFQDRNEENTFHEEKDSRMEEKEAQNDTDSQKELEEKGYTLPEYAFTVESSGVKSEESGQLDVRECSLLLNFP